MTRPRTARPVLAGTAAVILSLLVGCGAAHAPSAPAVTTPSPPPAASPAPTTPQARLQALYQVAKKEHGLVFHVGSADWK